MNDKSYQNRDLVRNLSDWKSFTVLWPFFKAQWKGYIFAFILLGVSSLMMIAGSKVLGTFVDRVLTQKHWDEMWWYISGFLFLEVCSILLMWIGRKLLAQYGTGSILEIRKKLFGHIHELPLRYYDKQPEGRTVTRLTHDVESIEEFFSSSFGRIVSATMIFLFAIIAMVVTFWKLGIILTISIIPAIYLTFSFKQTTRVVMRKMSKLNSACNAGLSEYLRGISVIRAFALNSWITKRYEKILDSYVESVLVANSFFSWSRPTINTLTYLPVFLLLLIGGRGVMEGWFTVGLLVTYIRYCENFASPISMISREINTIQQSFTSVERIVQFLSEDREDDLFGEDVVGDFSQQILGEVEFKNITMGYDKDRDILHGVSFTIKRGEKVGIVGKTGCGKTTIVSLLARLYPFSSGDILIDGHSISTWNRSHLRSQIGFISQDVTIFQGSLRDNLRVGSNVCDEQIIENCELSRFSKIMAEKNMSLDYQLQEGGANLSIGEKQLLAFTRVLLRNPAILILDEATANIDEKYESYLQEALVKSSKGRTVLIIAHRVHTLDICDKIISFDQGTLVAVKDIKNTTD